MTEAKPLTGRKVLIILLTAFGIIIAVNMTLLFKAIGTFPGLEVKNSYVASQTFDDRAQAQAAMGWDPQVKYADGRISVSIFANGAFIFPEEIDVRIGRPTHGREDSVPVLSRNDIGYWFDRELGNGKWFVYVNAVAADGQPFSTRLELFIKG